MKHADFLILIGGRCDRKWRFSKRETAFAGVQKNVNGEIFMNFIGGRCDRKWRFSKRKTAFAGVQKISDVLFYIQQALIIDNNFFKLQFQVCRSTQSHEIIYAMAKEQNIESEGVPCCCFSQVFATS